MALCDPNHAAQLRDQRLWALTAIGAVVGPAKRTEIRAALKEKFSDMGERAIIDLVNDAYAGRLLKLDALHRFLDTVDELLAKQSLPPVNREAHLVPAFFFIHDLAVHMTACELTPSNAPKRGVLTTTLIEDMAQGKRASYFSCETLLQVVNEALVKKNLSPLDKKKVIRSDFQILRKGKKVKLRMQGATDSIAKWSSPLASKNIWIADDLDQEVQEQEQEQAAQ